MYSVLLSISGFIEVQMKEKRAPYEGGPLTVLRDPLRDWFSKIKNDLFTSNVEFEDVRPARKYWLKLYHEILVLYHLVRLGEPVASFPLSSSGREGLTLPFNVQQIIVEGHVTPLFEPDTIQHRLSRWTVCSNPLSLILLPISS